MRSPLEMPKLVACCSCNCKIGQFVQNCFISTQYSLLFQVLPSTCKRCKVVSWLVFTIMSMSITFSVVVLMAIETTYLIYNNNNKTKYIESTRLFLARSGSNCFFFFFFFLRKCSWMPCKPLYI